MKFKPELSRSEIIRLLAIVPVPEHPSAVACVMRLCGVNLDGIDFSGMNLTGVDFTNASLRGCRFDRAIIEGCAFYDADLSHADFRGAVMAVALANAETQFSSANLYCANFHKVNASGNYFEHADFSGADLRGANFDACALRCAKFTLAKIEDTSVLDADFDYAAFDDAIGPECGNMLTMDEDRAEAFCNHRNGLMIRELADQQQRRSRAAKKAG